MRQSISIFLIALFLSNIAFGQISSGGAFSIEKSAVAAGGGAGSNGAFTLSGTTGQNAAGTNTTNAPFDQIGGFWTPDQLAPTAAVVSISGKVTTANGNGIKNVVVTLTGLNGSTRTIMTGSFGSYRFTDVEVGQTYILGVAAKKYVFTNPSQIVSVNEELTNLDFMANEQ